MSTWGRQCVYIRIVKMPKKVSMRSVRNTTPRASVRSALKRALLVGVSVAVLVPASIVAGASTASASATNGLPYVTQFADLFSSPTPYSNFNGGAFSGETVVMMGWTDAAWSLGTNRWFYVAVGIAVPRTAHSRRSKVMCRLRSSRTRKGLGTAEGGPSRTLGKPPRHLWLTSKYLLMRELLRDCRWAPK